MGYWVLVRQSEQPGEIVMDGYSLLALAVLCVVAIYFEWI